jgi:hypothetical protein
MIHARSNATHPSERVSIFARPITRNNTQLAPRGTDTSITANIRGPIAGSHRTTASPTLPALASPMRFARGDCPARHRDPLAPPRQRERHSFTNFQQLVCTRNRSRFYDHQHGTARSGVQNAGRQREQRHAAGWNLPGNLVGCSRAAHGHHIVWRLQVTEANGELASEACACRNSRFQDIHRIACRAFELRTVYRAHASQNGAV